MTAPIPANEPKRLKVLWQYEVLDTVPEEVFDDLTELAARICGAPIALISLVDEKRQAGRPDLRRPHRPDLAGGREAAVVQVEDRPHRQ
jgi:hypothetical protein